MSDTEPPFALGSSAFGDEVCVKESFQVVVDEEVRRQGRVFTPDTKN